MVKVNSKLKMQEIRFTHTMIVGKYSDIHSLPYVTVGPTHTAAHGQRAGRMMIDSFIRARKNSFLLSIL
jgi:hypothetical protein